MNRMTLAYLIQDDQWLMLLRNKKKNDINEGKWIGVGGKIEPGETPQQGVSREILEETGYTCSSPDFRGILYFRYEDREYDKIWVYTSSSFTGTQSDCIEGTLAWIKTECILELPLWEGDIPFLKLLLAGKKEPFCMDLNYSSDGKLISAEQKEAEQE